MQLNHLVYKNLIGLLVSILLLIAHVGFGQNGAKNHKNYKKNSKNFYAKRYSKNYVKADKQCDRLREKKFRKKNKQVAKVNAKKAKKQPVLAEVDINDIPPKPAPKPKPKPTTPPKAEPKPDIDNMDLEEKHEVEDEVLKKNNLPAPTSDKHEQIRKEVESHLENFENEKPLKLEPLYFVTGQDEFAFVDMDPFLVAVEYALQGKHVLIEGHTDHVGNFEANVALSIKRVERIRDLMVQMGVHDDKISVVGYGEEKSAKSEEGSTKQEERRVDFTVF